MKKLSYVFYLVLGAFLIGCQAETPSKCGKFVVRMGTSEWNNATINDVDSLQMKSETEIDIWVSGKKQTVHSEWIMIGRYPNCP